MLSSISFVGLSSRILMPFAYYNRLSAPQRQIYRASDAIEVVELPKAERLYAHVDALEQALAGGNRRATEQAAQTLLDGMTRLLRVSSLRVQVGDRRPSWTTGELHGLYEPQSGRRDKVAVWMRTAQRAQTVKFKTFLRTLLHEVCHHLDYERFRLAESFHTQGFYKRESSLLRRIHASHRPGARPRPISRSRPPQS